MAAERGSERFATALQAFAKVFCGEVRTVNTSRSRINGHATNVDAPSIPLGKETGAAGGGLADVAVSNAPVFSSAELEQLAWRRFNPLSTLSALTLSAALDAFATGLPSQAARIWTEICRREETLASVKSKREESVALRDWTVVPLDNSPAAKDQAAALSNFYRSFRAGHSLNRHEVGGFPLLVTQMMEAVAFRYAIHHLIWKPDAVRQWTLPSGKSVPTLNCQAEYVPLEYFEARTGELRFLGSNQGITGETLDPGAWMVTTGPGLMIAGSILYWYKRLATHDLVNFSEKFGTPGLIIHTTDAQNSPGGQMALQLARSLAGNYRGVQYGAQENKVEIVWPSGGTGSGNLPMTGIIQDVSRQMAILFLGADLSTMSRGGDGVGASIQGEEQEKRLRADCARITETLNATLDPIVLRWYFGDQAPVLAKVVIEAPVNEDKKALWNLVSGMVGLGAKVPVADIAKRLNVPVDPDGPEFFVPAAAPAAPISDTGGDAAASNVAPARRPKPDGANLGPLLAKGRLMYADAALADMQPLATAIQHVLGADDDGLEARARKLHDALPHLGSQIIAANNSADALIKILGAAVATGIASGEEPPTLS